MYTVGGDICQMEFLDPSQRLTKESGTILGIDRHILQQSS